jgi:hypothetical protein
MSLSPSQRLVLIKVIAERLGNESWSLVDITLTEFGLPTQSNWNGDVETYVLKQVQSAPDQTLIDLAQHVGYKFEQAAVSGVEPPFWHKDMLRLFISHLATHKIFAAELQEALLEYGISAFVAHNDIEPTLEWQAQIEAALTTCEALLALLHDKFHASNWTDQEIGFVMGRRMPAFAVRFSETPYGFIGRFQAFNGNGKTAAVLAREIFDSFRKNKQTQRRMNEVLVTLFEKSGSFAQAKERIGFLEELEVWSPSFSSRVRAAAEANSQISSSWGVPSRVEALLKKWKKASATAAG